VKVEEKSAFATFEEAYKVKLVEGLRVGQLLNWKFSLFDWLEAVGLGVCPLLIGVVASARLFRAAYRTRWADDPPSAQ